MKDYKISEMQAMCMKKCTECDSELREFCTDNFPIMPSLWVVRGLEVEPIMLPPQNSPNQFKHNGKTFSIPTEGCLNVGCDIPILSNHNPIKTVQNILNCNSGHHLFEEANDGTNDKVCVVCGKRAMQATISIKLEPVVENITINAVIRSKKGGK